MEIEFPKRYWLQLGMLVEEGCSASRLNAAAAIFHQGLEDAVEDVIDDDLHEPLADVIDGGEHLIDESFLTGARLRIEIPDRPPWRPFDSQLHERTSSEWLSILYKALGISPGEASTIAFAYGLTRAYAQLVESPRYRISLRFKARVNRLPHYAEDDPDVWPAVEAEAALVAQDAAEIEAAALDNLPPGVTLDTMSREELDDWVDQQLRLEDEEDR